jgi:hypothetical protein
MTERNDDPALGHTLAGEWHGPDTVPVDIPGAEIVLYGVEEPACLIHAPNESVAPSEIEHLALAEALFLRKYGAFGL